MFLLLPSPLQQSIYLHLPLQAKEKKQQPPIEQAGATSPEQEPIDVEPFVSAQLTRKEVGYQKFIPILKVSKLYFYSKYRQMKDIFGYHEPPTGGS